MISCKSGVTAIIALSGSSPRQHNVLRCSTAPIGPPALSPTIKTLPVSSRTRGMRTQHLLFAAGNRVYLENGLGPAPFAGGTVLLDGLGSQQDPRMAARELLEMLSSRSGIWS